MASTDTIHALASGSGRAGIAVLRVSGPRTADILIAIAGRLPPPRRATLRALRDHDGTLLDRALVLWFPAPGSFTGEDLGELHIHGGSTIIAAVDGRLRELGARSAEAGEFSRRAFLNGRIDLLVAEGLADLVNAETDAQRRQALLQSEGALSRVYEAWAETLRETLALQEADLDFPDETGGTAVEDAIATHLEAMISAFSLHLTEGQRAARLRTGVVVCISGAPNVGKSSLMNQLAQDDVSIVSERPGTTRDLVETRLILAGVPVTLVDTAGLRETDDDVEAEGVRRARTRADAADLVIELMLDGDDPPPPAANAIRVTNKADLGPAGYRADTSQLRMPRVSARTGVGIPDLLALLTDRVEEIASRTTNPAMTRGRHRSCIEAAHAHLLAARATVVAELKGEELRLAMRELGRLTGRVDVEDVLDSIFSSFCIGK